MLRTRKADCVRNWDWQSKNAPGRRKIADISASGSVATGRRSLAPAGAALPAGCAAWLR
ncbi:hypothetical protein [Paenibacillus sp. YN15]|uniref:hypothetical protein n=1 Tax=Paenibacillus sp. YN15 TaxID=1742774 RepID=UPI0015EC67B3|nr:hypothetical protein [Paenibacillus sp. YN15]